jgi:hypothetical protein
MHSVPTATLAHGEPRFVSQGRLLTVFATGAGAGQGATTGTASMASSTAADKTASKAFGVISNMWLFCFWVAIASSGVAACGVVDRFGVYNAR